MTRSQNVAADVAALLRARNPLLWVVTREEARAEAYLIEAAASAGYVARCWDVAAGCTGPDGKALTMGGADPGDMLDTIKERAQATGRADRCAWIMRDLPDWLAPPIGIATTRKLRNLARLLPAVGRENAQAVIVLTPSADVPPQLAGHATVVDWPLPDRDEIGATLDAAIASLPDEIRESAAPNGTRDAAIDAAVGLTEEEAQATFAKSLVQLRRIDPAAVAAEKKRVIARERLLEWFDPLPGGLSAVGGLDVLKAWLTARKSAYSAEARAYGLPAPRGVFLAGISGCGKSLSAKAIATSWGVPLLKIDLGALKSKFVGESEGNLRRVFQIIETIGRCVVWIDEVEKGLSGATDGAADGGVSKDALGAILTWMQERRGEAFVIATANDVSGLPPELMRKGRFDELFFIDLPTRPERAEIIAAALRQFQRDAAEVIPSAEDMRLIVDATEAFTGSEIAALVPDSLFAAFDDGQRAIATEDLLRSALTVTPLAKTAAETIDKLRSWAEGRARRATSAEKPAGTAQVAGRALDL